MKKRNLIILLIMPFIVALFSFTVANITINVFDNDIIAIEWDYNDVEAFKVSEEHTYELKATGLNDVHYPSKGGKIFWSVKNKDTSILDPLASIIIEENKASLKALKEGEVIITASNEKGNITRSMTGILYENGMVMCNPSVASSQNNVDPNVYYGEYDYSGVHKSKAIIEYQVTTIPRDVDFEVIDYSSELISYQIDQNLDTFKVEVKEAGEAYFVLGGGHGLKEFRVDLHIVDEGVNVYNYDQLLKCTNNSENGEKVVLRTSLESVNNTYKLNSNGDLILVGGEPVQKNNNVNLFGHYDHSRNRYSFLEEVYKFPTTYNKDYINQWNEFAKKNSNIYRPISDIVCAGIRVQQDFYGNGYTINLHNLTFPYEYQEKVVNGVTYRVPSLREDNLFRGPLPYYTLGDPNSTPLVGVYGQDNIGLYLDGNNITINDLNLKNCDFGNSFSNLEYVGTVIDINGDNNTIKNSRFANGKNVMRSFSNLNLLVENCMLSYARNFLISTGSNETLKVDANKKTNFLDHEGNSYNLSNADFFKKGGQADMTLNTFLENKFDHSLMKQALYKMQEGLDETSVASTYKGDMIIRDTYFYKSGIASISLDTAFNGPYLYSNIPSLIGELFSSFSEGTSGAAIVPYEANLIGGSSYPVNVKLQGKTKFYDYKDIDKMDLSGLILENISAIANSVGQNVRPITIDDIFPLRRELENVAQSNMIGKYINIPVAYYGGGVNYSYVNEVLLDQKLTKTVSVDLLEEYLKLPTSGNYLSVMKNMMQKCVTVVTGYHDFKFTLMKGNQTDIDLAPTVEMLKENAKGA